MGQNYCSTGWVKRPTPDKKSLRNRRVSGMIEDANGVRGMAMAGGHGLRHNFPDPNEEEISTCVQQRPQPFDDD